MTDADLILVGGGLANTLIALRLAETHPELRLLILEQADRIGGNHTWSYHGHDLTAEQRNWLAPLTDYNWKNYSVQFPGYRRTLDGTYHSMTSDCLAELARQRLGKSILTDSTVNDLGPNAVVLSDGSKLEARAVVDGRGPVSSPHLDVRFQKFVGWEVELDQPHGLASPIIMDATIEQDDGYRFFYSLPFTANTLLIEDTHYSDGPQISAEQYSEEIQNYARSRGWQIRRRIRAEEGVLPITLGGDIEAFWDNQPESVARSGLSAALFHPATGYSLPNAARLAWHLDTELRLQPGWTANTVYETTRKHSIELWQSTRFYRALNRMLFLAAAPAERRVVLKRFYSLNPGLIARFYAGQNTLADKMRILAGKPPVAILPAWRSVFGYRHAASIKES